MASRSADDPELRQEPKGVPESRSTEEIGMAQTVEAKAATSRQVRRAEDRHTRVVVRKVGPWSVFKFSLLFYFCLMLVILFALVILYAILGAIGALDTITRLMRELFPDPTFEIHGDWLFWRGLVVGLVMVVVWSLINLCVAFLYNLISDVVGGIEVTLSDRRP